MLVVAPAHATAEQTGEGSVLTGETWDLAHDFRQAPAQANPAPDSYGNAKVWSYMDTTTVGVSGTYHLLHSFSQSFYGVSGLQAWYNNAVASPPTEPSVGLNTTGVDQHVFGFVWPAGAIHTHPAPTYAAVIAWRSPITGTVVLNTSLVDTDPGCGDGVHYSLLRANVLMQAGTLNGTSVTINRTFKVNKGMSLYVAIDSGRAHDYCGDSTDIALTITG